MTRRKTNAREREMHKRISAGNLKDGNHLGNQGVDRRITLKLILEIRRDCVDKIKVT